MAEGRRMPVIKFAAFAFLLLVCAATCRADSATYVYVGNDFTRCSNGACPTNYSSDYITASVTFSAPLGNNLSLTDELSSVTAWTIQDALGYFSFSSTDTNAAAELLNLSGQPADMSFSTDSLGGILDYLVDAGNANTSAIIINPTFTGGSGLQIADTEIINKGLATQWTAANSSPGQWTEVPEPSTLLLMSLGGAILILFAARIRLI